MGRGNVARLRTAPIFWQPGQQRVDRANAVIHNVVAMQADVEAIGHGIMSDLKTLQLTAALAQQHRFGVRGRFGHPAMSENSAGRKVMTADNFRVENGKLLHDVNLLESARKSPAFPQDPVEYILDVAENDPQELAESAVLAHGLVWTFADGREFDIYDYTGMREAGLLQKDGEEEDDEDDDEDWEEQPRYRNRPKSALTPLPIIRPTTLYYIDIVNEGALTHDGLFSKEIAGALFLGSSVEAQQAFDLVDNWREEYGIALEDVPKKASQLVERYLALRRGGTMATNINKSKPASTRVRKLDAAPDPKPKPEDEDEEEKVETTEAPEAEPDALDDALADAEAAGNEPEGSDEGAENEGGESGGENRLSVQLSARFADLEAQNAKLTRVVLAQGEAIKRLSARLAAAERPNVQKRVTFAPSQLSSNGGKPPQAVLNQNPRDAADRYAAARQGGQEQEYEEPINPDAAVLLMSQRRSSAQNQN